MSFQGYEHSEYSGKPVCLYHFQWGNTHWRYTNADRKITRTEIVSGEFVEVEYVPVVCSDGGVKQGGSDQNDFIVTIQADIPLVDLYRSTPPSEPVRLVARRMHYNDPEAEANVHWVGRVANVKRKEERTTAEVRATSMGVMLARTGLRLTWDRNCPHILYDQECKVDPQMFRTDTTVFAVAGNTVTVQSRGAYPGYYRGGIITWDSDGLGTLERRGIQTEDGDLLTILGRADRLVVGQAVTLHPGCDRTVSRCKNLFSNLANHGGFPQMPGKSPFDGTPIF